MFARHQQLWRWRHVQTTNLSGLVRQGSQSLNVQNLYSNDSIEGKQEHHHQQCSLRRYSHKCRAVISLQMHGRIQILAREKVLRTKRRLATSAQPGGQVRRSSSMSCWQRHRTGCRRSPVRSLPLPSDATMRLYAGGALALSPGMLFPNSRGIKAAAIPRLRKRSFEKSYERQVLATCRRDLALKFVFIAKDMLNWNLIVQNWIYATCQYCLP